MNLIAHLLPIALVCCAASAQAFNLKAPIASKPAFLTSAGQSADVEMVKVLLDRAGIPYKVDATAPAATLAASGAKSLVFAIGSSAKGLDSAGLSADAELVRSMAVLTEARKLGMRIIGLHVGGEARRSELSDRFAVAVAPLCDYVIVVAEGNKDGLFTRLCARTSLDIVDKVTKVGDPLAKAFLK